MAGPDQRLHPALLALTIHRSEPVSLQVGSLEHQREGELNISLGAFHPTALQDDEPQQVSVSGALLVEEQVRLQDEPPAKVDAASLFLCRKNGELLHDLSVDV